MSDTRTPEENPVDPAPPTLGAPKTSAAGAAALANAVAHVAKHSDLGKAWGVLENLNQRSGFDCPGCAWPDPAERSELGEYCENGVKALAEESSRRRCDPAFFAKHSIASLAARDDYWLGKQGRLTHPMHKGAGDTHYRPIEWAEAFDRIADGLKSIPDPKRALFYTSGRTSNEAAFLYQLMVRLLGTNNLPDCSNMCHESSGVGLGSTLGIGKGSVRLSDFDHAEVILVIGQNPGTNHPRMLSALARAKKRGAHIIAINPLLEAGLLRFRDPQKLTDMVGLGTKLADLYLQNRIGSDIALLKAFQRELLLADQSGEESIAREFIADKTDGFSDHRRSLLDGPSTESLLADTGLSRKDFDAALDLLRPAKRIIASWAMGLTQHRFGVANVREVVNLLLMKGAIGKRGAGTCPVRGHSNVQGDRTMGIWERPSEAFLQSLEEGIGAPMPRAPGHNVVEGIEAMSKGEIDLFFCLGGNFLSAAPDTHLTAEAMRRPGLSVHVSTKLNRSHLVQGETALILPCLGRSEEDLQDGVAQFVSVENSMGVVHASQGKARPASPQLHSEVAIVSGLARRALPNSPVDWSALRGDYGRIRDLIADCIPGFEDYDQRIRNPDGFELPNGPRDGDFSRVGGRAKFSVHPSPDLSLEAEELWMMTIRSHDQFNTTIYGLDDRYRGIRGQRRVVMMNAEDMRSRSLKSLDVVDLVGRHYPNEERSRRAEHFFAVPYDIPQGNIATYFPEANPLVPLHLSADESHTPASKAIPTRVEFRHAAT